MKFELSKPELVIVCQSITKKIVELEKGIEYVQQIWDYPEDKMNAEIKLIQDNINDHQELHDRLLKIHNEGGE